MFQHSNHAFDDRFERQVIRASQRLAFGKRVANPWLDACAEIMLSTFNPNKHIEGCSNGALRFSYHVKPVALTQANHVPPR